MMQGVVMVFINWYVPTVFVSKDKLVKTTNPQKVHAKGNILSIGSRFG